VVVPVHLNEGTLRELSRRIHAALSPVDRYQLIFVDDASPDRSGAALREMAAADASIEVLALESNRGQHAAVLAGIRRARGEWLVTLDADLQDPPEAIPRLIERASEGFDVVFAGRRGRYENSWRLVTSRTYRAALSKLLGLPLDAGMFMAMRRSAGDALLALQGPPPQIVAMVGAAGLRTTSLPVRRGPRLEGSSAYTTAARVSAAVLAFRWALRRRRASVSKPHRLQHNEAQRRYFEDRPKRRMIPRHSRYLERHVEHLIRFAALREGDRVLELGCGMGRYTLPLAARGLEVAGMDISPKLLARLREYAPARSRISLHEGDVLDPPPQLRGRFDAVVGLFVLHHLQDVAACARSVAALLVPGGRVAFLEPNAYNPLYYAQIALTPTMSWDGDKGVAAMRPRLLHDALSAGGFAELRLERFGFFPPFASERPRGAALERWLERIAPLRPFLPFQLIGGRLADASS
jgi:glycosyltransferase involved in cell wall biosynthesis